MKPIKAVDLFCGAGGGSTGFTRACRSLRLKHRLLAINHWPTAIQTHTLNHPDVQHLCESIERVNPREAVPGGRLNLLIAAPECTFFSTARGGRPVNEQQRTQPWVILKWLQELYVDKVLIENVPEFMQWGPIGVNGKPLKSRKGETYRAFIETIRSLGYRVEDRILNAADFGDPTTRRRLFIIATRGNKPITWPVPSHSRSGGRTLFGQTTRWRAAREVIDWSIKGQSIFGRKKPLSSKTVARIMAGLERFGGTELKPFLVILRNHADARSLDEPVPTLAAQGQHVGLCEPFLLQQQSGGVAREVGEPLPTIATAGAISLIEPFLVPHFGERHAQKPRTHSVDEPVPTIAATGRIDVVQPFIVGTGGPSYAGEPKSIDQPLGTVMTREHKALVEATFLASYYGTKNISPVSDPLPTVTTKDRFALVMPVVNGRALDIRLRMLKPHELARAMSFGDDYQFAGNQGDKVKQVGNAIPCALAQALIGSLLQEYAAPAKRKLEAIA